MSPAAFETLKKVSREYGVNSIEQGGRVWSAIREASASSLYFFNKFIWSAVPPSENIMTWRTHGSICMLCQDETILRLLIEFPRRFLKSSIATVSYPPWKLAQMVTYEKDPWHRFFIMSHNKKTAQKQWEDIRLGFARDKFQFFYPELIPPRNGSFHGEDTSKPFKWNEEQGEILRSRRTKEPTFEALAGHVVGPHYNHGTLDDLVNSENYRSVTAIENAVDSYKHAGALLDDHRTSRIFIVGNSWGMNDLNAEVHREIKKNGFTILSVSAETGPNFEGDRICHEIPEPVLEVLKLMPEGAIWPERFNEEDLAAIRQDLGPRIYSSQYLNCPEDPELVAFDSSLVKSLSIINTELGPALKYEDEEEPMLLSNCNVYVIWDPALDKTRATRLSRKSSNAITVTFMDPYGRCGVLREHSRIEDPLTSMDTWFNLCKIYHPYLRGAGVEEVLFQKVLKKLISKRIKEKKLSIPLKKIKTPKTVGGKDARILGWLGFHIQKGVFYVANNCPKSRKEIRLFGVKGATRDLLDTMAYGTRLWRKPKFEYERIAITEKKKLKESDRGLTGYGRICA